MILLRTAPGTAITKVEHTSCFTLARSHCLNTAVVLAVVHGLFGLLRVGDTRTSHSLPPPPSPSLISHLDSVDVKQHVYLLVAVVADGLFCLCGSERLRRAVHRYRIPSPLSSVPSIPYVISMDVKPPNLSLSLSRSSSLSLTHDARTRARTHARTHPLPPPPPHTAIGTTQTVNKRNFIINLYAINMQNDEQ